MQATEFFAHSPDDVIAHLARRSPVLPKSADVVVIGGGIMGAACAYYLAQRGLSVVLLEKGRVASQQSGRNWGFVRTQYRDPVELPLAMAALSMWPGLERELGQKTGWVRNGCIFVAESELEQQRFECWHQQTRDVAVDARMLSAREVTALLPPLGANGSSALFTHTDGQAEPVLATTAFARAAERLGVAIVENCGALEIDVAGGGVCGVLSEFGPIRTSAVICAAGARSHQLLSRLGFVVPQQLVRSTVSLTSILPALSSACFVGFGLGLRQRADGSCIIAADSAGDIDLTLDSFRAVRFFLSSFRVHRKTFSLSFGRPFFDDLFSRICLNRRDRMIEPRHPRISPNHKLAATTAALLQRLFGVSDRVAIAKTWAGHIDVMPDALPIIDAPSRIAGLVVATGFSGHGFGLGPAIGRLGADLVCGTLPDVDLGPFVLERFQQGNYGLPYAPL